MLETVSLNEGAALKDGEPEAPLEIDAVPEPLADGGFDTSLLDEAPLNDGVALPDAYG
jgi:hypothetical protein